MRAQIHRTLQAVWPGAEVGVLGKGARAHTK
jgi:hypothetical protein